MLKSTHSAAPDLQTMGYLALQLSEQNGQNLKCGLQQVGFLKSIKKTSNQHIAIGEPYFLCTKLLLGTSELDECLCPTHTHMTRLDNGQGRSSKGTRQFKKMFVDPLLLTPSDCLTVLCLQDFPTTLWVYPHALIFCLIPLFKP